MEFVLHVLRHCVACAVLVSIIPIPAAIAGQPPLTAGSFILQSMVNNEDQHPGLGSTWSYSGDVRTHGADRIKATVYLYSRENGGVPTGVDSDAVKIEFAAALSKIREFNNRVQRTVAPEVAELRGHSVRYAQFLIGDTDDGDGSISHLVLTGLGGQFVKIRITHPRTEAEAYMGRITDFLGDVVAAIDEKKIDVGLSRVEQCKDLAEIAFWAAQSHLDRGAKRELESVAKDASRANARRDAIAQSEIDRAAIVGGASHGNRGEGLTKIGAARMDAILTAIQLNSQCMQGESF